MKNQAAKSSIRSTQNLPTSPKMGRTVSNLNSPRGKIQQTKETGLPKSPPSTNSKITDVKSQRGNQVFETDTSTQDHGIKSTHTLTSPAKNQMPTQASSISSQQIPKADYSKKQPRIGSPRNNFNMKPSFKKNPQENSAVPTHCKNCEELKAKCIENQSKLEEIQKKIEQDFEQKNIQMSKLLEERKSLKDKMAVYEEIVKKNKKLIKQQVSEFHGSGKQKEQYITRIRQLEDTVKKLQKQKEERDLERQKSTINSRHQIKFANMIEVESQFISHPQLGVPQNNDANLKQQSRIQDQNFNESSIYRMIHSKNTQSEMNENGHNYKDKEEIEKIEKIKKQFEGSLGEICEQFQAKVKNLQDEVNNKYEQIISLKEEVIVGKKEKEAFEAKLKEVTSSVERLRRENSTLRSRITQYEQSKTKNADCTESTLQSVSEQSIQQKRNLLKELCMQRRRNNRNCLNKLDRMKSIQEQQCAIINNFQNTSRIMFSEIEQLAQE